MADDLLVRHYRHRKTGNTYTLLHRGKHTETGEELVVYMGTDGKVWCRPAGMFFDGRFEPVTHNLRPTKEAHSNA